MSEKRKRRFSGKWRARRRRIRNLLLVCLVLAILLGAYGIYHFYSTDKIEVEGNVTYTAGEITRAVEEDEFIPNNMFMILHNRIFHLQYLPFVEKMTMTTGDSTHTLKIKVKEKYRAGVFEHMNRFYYFNENGYVMESRNSLFNNVPIVLGLRFKDVEPESKMEVRENCFDFIVALVQEIKSNHLDISEIRFRSENDVVLISGNYKIHIGPDRDLNGKMTRIPALIESISKEHSSGVIDLHLYDEDKKYITFRE